MDGRLAPALLGDQGAMFGELQGEHDLSFRSVGAYPRFLCVIMPP
jgi:hypothetical protein